MVIAESDCMTCVHATIAPDGSVANCDAFPKGIPEPILRGQVHHDTPFPGDHGILYRRVGSRPDGGVAPHDFQGAGSAPVAAVGSPDRTPGTPSAPPSTY